MAYYTALIDAWRSTTQPPPGVNGVALTSTMTTHEKIVAVDNWTVTTPQLALVSQSQLLNAIQTADFMLLGTPNLSRLQIVLQGVQLDASPNTQIRNTLATLFSTSSSTLTALSALYAPYDNAQTLWTQLHGYPPGNLSTSDCQMAGLT